MIVSITITEILKNCHLTDLDELEKEITARRNSIKEFLKYNPPLNNEDCPTYCKRMKDRYNVGENEPHPLPFFVSSFWLSKK